MFYTIEPKFVSPNEFKSFLKNALFMVSIFFLPIGIFIPLKNLYFETQCKEVFYRGTYFPVCGRDRKNIKTWKDLEKKYFSKKSLYKLFK